MRTVIDFLSGTRFFNPFDDRRDAKYYKRLITDRHLRMSYTVFCIIFLLMCSSIMGSVWIIVIEVFIEFFTDVVTDVFHLVTTLDYSQSNITFDPVMFYALIPPAFFFLFGLMLSIFVAYLVKKFNKEKVGVDALQVPYVHERILNALKLFFWRCLMVSFLIISVISLLYTLMDQEHEKSPLDLAAWFLEHLYFFVTMFYVFWRFICYVIVLFLLGASKFKFFFSFSLNFVIYTLFMTLPIYILVIPELAEFSEVEQRFIYFFYLNALLFFIIIILWLLARFSDRLREVILGRHGSLLYVKDYWLMNEEVEPSAIRNHKIREKLREYNYGIRKNFDCQNL